MPVDAKEESGNLVHVEVRDELAAFIAKPLRAILTEYFGSEALAWVWLDA